MALFHRSTIWKISDELPSPPKPVKVKKERGVLELEGHRTHFCCPAPVPEGSPRCCSVALSRWTCLSFTGTSPAPFRSFGRAENYQHLSHLACPPTAKQCVFCWNGGSLTAAENPRVFPASFRYMIVIWGKLKSGSLSVLNLSFPMYILICRRTALALSSISCFISSFVVIEGKKKNYVWSANSIQIQLPPPSSTVLLLHEN